MKVNNIDVKVNKEKTIFEKLKSTIKENIFNLMHSLLKNNNDQLWLEIIIIIIQTLQMLAFPCSLIFASAWKSGDTFIQMSFFFQYFQLVTFLQDNAYMFNIIFYLCIIIIVSIVIWTTCCLIYMFNNKQFSKGHLSFMNTIFHLLSTVLYLPILQILISVFYCVDPDQIFRESAMTTPSNTPNSLRSLLVNYYIPEMTCYASYHFVHVVFAGIFIIVFVILCLVITMTLIDSKLNNTSPNIRLSCTFDKIFMLIKTVLCVIFCFFGKKFQPWFHIVILLICSVILVYIYDTTSPYLNVIIRLLYQFCITLFLWTCIVVLIGMIFQQSEFDGAIPLFLIGIPGSGIMLLSNSFRHMKILLSQIFKYTNGEEALNQIRLFLYIINHKDESRRWGVLLKGYAYQYESTCPLVGCPLKKYLSSLEKGNEINMLLLQHIELLFDIAIAKFTQCISLRIGHCFFLLEYLNQKSQAIQHLIKIENLEPSFEEQFIIFHYKKLIEEQLTDVNEAEDNHDIIMNKTYKKHFVLFKQNINKVAMLYIDFWSILLQSSRNQEQLSELNKSGSQIQDLIKDIKDLFEKMQKIRPNDQEAIYYYYDFLNDILNDSEKATYYHSKLNQLENTKEVISDINLFNLDINTLSSSDEYQYIVLSGQRENFGIITQVSFGICTLLGYYKEELVGKANEVLMPEIFHSMHRHMLHNKVNLFKKEMTDMAGDSVYKPTMKDISSFARNKARYLIPVSFQVALISTETEGISFIAKLKQEQTAFSNNSSICYIITNNHFVIQNYTTNSATLLRLNSNVMNKNYDIITFIKQFHEEYIKNIYERERDDITFEQKTMIKKQIINNKFRSPVVITWRMNDLTDIRNRSSKLIESQLSSSADMTKLNKFISAECQLTLTVHDAMIGGKQEGYVFKFTTVNAHNSSNIYLNTSQLFTSFNNLKDQTVPTKKTSLKVMKISKKSNNDLADSLYDQLKTSVPEGNSVFVLNMKEMSYVMNSKTPLDIRDEIKNKAFELIAQTLKNNNKTITSADDSSENDDGSNSNRHSDNSQSPHSSATLSSVSECEIDDKKNTMVDFAIPSPSNKQISTKNLDTRTTDDYYKVIMTNIKYSLYSFQKHVTIEISNYVKKSQVEAKMNDEFFDEKSFQSKKSLPQKEQTNANEEIEIIDKEGILLKQIEQALTKRENQPTVLKLKLVVFFAVIILLGFNCAWGALTLIWNNNLNENYLLIKHSSYLIVNSLFSQANIRDLTLLSHENYTNPWKTDELIINELTTELRELFNQSHTYNIHIITSQLPLSPKSLVTLYNQTIQVMTIQDDYNVTSYNMTLSSTFIEVNTAAFHISKNTSDFYATNKYIFFYMYNLNNEVLKGLEEQEIIFVEEFGIIIQKSRQMFITIMVVIYVILIGSYFLFAWSYNAMAQKRDSYPIAFWEIGNGFVSVSLRNCELFSKKMQFNSFQEFLSSEDNDHDPLATCPIRRNKTKSEIIQQSKETVMIKILYALCMFAVIFLSLMLFISYVFFLDKLKTYMEILKTQNEVFIEHLTVYRNLREFVFDDTIIVNNQSIGDYFPDYILTFFNGLFQKMTTYLSFRDQFPASYADLYTRLYHTKLCELLTIPGGNCTDALFKSTNYGLEILLSVFVEEIRELKNMMMYLRSKSDASGYEFNMTMNGLKEYKEYFPLDENEYATYFSYSPINLFNHPTYHKVKFTYEYFIKPSIKMLQLELSNCFELYIKKLTIILLAINAFYILMTLIVYLCIWKPYENSLEKVIFKSKNMLGIIPIKILATLSNIQKLLNINISLHQSIMRTNQ